MMCLAYYLLLSLLESKYHANPKNQWAEEKDSDSFGNKENLIKKEIIKFQRKQPQMGRALTNSELQFGKKCSMLN